MTVMVPVGCRHSKHRAPFDRPRGIARVTADGTTRIGGDGPAAVSGVNGAWFGGSVVR
ncbi:MAG TPA: hypothetical protein VJ978_10400 [Nitriliruptoraceae bacterium]|nr:hypothetical protein [Nitriliruptoraceae bacterium]